MANIDNIRNSLINKLLSIRNKEFLMALDELISSRLENKDELKLSREQVLMLRKSLKDYENGKIISQEDLQTKAIKWLRENG